MTNTSRKLLDEFQTRHSQKQKSAFRDWIKPVLEEAGYSVTVERGALGSQNVVIGNIEDAAIVFTAHYDTCRVLPFPNVITPKAPPLYWAYSLLILAPLLGAAFASRWIFSKISPELAQVGYNIGYFLSFGLLCFGPANKHTANDNTSGVATVIDLARAMPEELRQKAAFILFDMEESGLIGSASFAKAHKQEMKNKLLLNLDCVSDGKTMFFAVGKGALKHLDKLKIAFPAKEGIEPDFATKRFIYPSDQRNFPVSAAVAALNKTRHGLLYMDKIHTPKDTVFQEENITYLVDGCINLTKMM